MKIKNNKILALLAVVAGAVIANQTLADVVLNVDITDISAVTFSATGAPSAVNDSSSSSLDGASLLNLFTVAYADNQSASSGSLFGSSSDALDTDLTPFQSLTGFDLNLYALSGTGAIQNFSTVSPAFSGSTTFDLSGSSILLGSTGDVIAGDTLNGSGAVIGQWQAIPEPASIGLLGLVSCGIFFTRRIFAV
jgi:hypothetical protein